MGEQVSSCLTAGRDLLAPRSIVLPAQPDGESERLNSGAGSQRVLTKPGQVAERSMAAGCKPAAPCELRGFESSPVHQLETGKLKLETPDGMTEDEFRISIFQFPKRGRE